LNTFAPARHPRNGISVAVANDAAGRNTSGLGGTTMKKFSLLLCVLTFTGALALFYFLG